MFKGPYFPKVVFLHAVYCKLRFGLSYRDIEELLAIRGIKVNHATIQRSVFKCSALLDQEFRKRKQAVGGRCRMDETYIKVQGKWRYLYRAVDKQGNTVDFLLTKRRQRMNAQSFLIKATEGNGLPQIINIDKSGANTSAIKVYNKRSFLSIEVRQCKYLNNIIEQDHLFIKRRISPGPRFKDFESAKRTISGIEVVRMIQKKQMDCKDQGTFKSFCLLAA
jgi:putative transposase